MLARCPACNTLHETTQELAMANEPCGSCWQLGFRPDGLGGVTSPIFDSSQTASGLPEWP